MKTYNVFVKWEWVYALSFTPYWVGEADSPLQAAQVAAIKFSTENQPDEDMPPWVTEPSCFVRVKENVPGEASRYFKVVGLYPRKDATPIQAHEMYAEESHVD